MFNTIRMFGGLFAAAFIFITGNGLLNTLLSARMAAEGFSTTTTGFVLSCFFVGLLVGSFIDHRMIQKVGHIRSFAVFAAVTTAAALSYGLHISPWFWSPLRFVSGVSTIGLFMVIESWLNECCEPSHRGRVFSVYMSLTYMAVGTGQQLLNVGRIDGAELFLIAGMVFALCMVPVSATEGIHPSLPERKPLRIAAIFKRVPLGMLGCLVAGLTNSAFFAMTPVLCTAIGLSIHQLSWIMSLTVLSGLVAQWVVGAVSDRFDRTVVLTATTSGIAVVCAFIFIQGSASFWVLAIEMVMFGSLVFATYPLSVARAHDIFEGRDTVAVSACLLFAYSIGASISPLLASGLMTVLETPFGLFAYWGVNNGILALVIVMFRRHEKVTVVPVEDQVSFVPMKDTSPVAMMLDPRTDADGDPPS
jgi:MFS family permease